MIISFNPDPGCATGMHRQAELFRVLHAAPECCIIKLTQSSPFSEGL